MQFIIKSRTGEEYLVREARMEDLDKILAYITELVNEKVYIDMNYIPTREEEREWLKERVSGERLIYWVVEKDGKIVGSVEASRKGLRQEHVVEIGIALLKEARGRGLGKELMKRLLNEVFKKWSDVKLVWLGVFSENEPAKNLYWKLGFRPVARLPAWNSYSGRYIDEEIWYWKDSPLVKELGIKLE